MTTPKLEIATLRPESMGLPGGPLGPETQREEIQEVLGFASDRANVIGPLTQIDRIPIGYVLSIRIVLLPLTGMMDGNRLRPDRYLSNGLWHKLPGKGDIPDRVAMQKAALEHIAGAAGCDYLGTRRLDDRSITNFWEVESGIKVRNFDGSVRDVWAGIEYDLRDGTPEAKKAGGLDSAGKPKHGLSEARRFGYRLAESKARLRAIRAAFGIRPLEVWEAQRPFVFPVLQWMPDMANPEIAKMVAAKELGMIGQVYGGQAQAQAVTVDARPALPAPDPFEQSPFADDGHGYGKDPAVKAPIRTDDCDGGPS